ncbi:MAG: alanine dehydrogenase [Bacteroidales bacterium]|nr:alanine dehydrogenase [Bacteroidales bacterium]
MKLVIVRETKTPKDRRAPITPGQCKLLLESYPDLKIGLQPDKDRCFSDKEYAEQGVELVEDIIDFDLLMGVKEIKAEFLLPGRNYMFFSHTAKKQRYNLPLLRAAIEKKIRLIDYEYLTDENRNRIVAFGRWAGMVGAYNALRAYWLMNGQSDLKPASACHDMHELFGIVTELDTPEQRIVLTGGGRVAHGAMETLDAAGFKKLSPLDFLNNSDQQVYTQLDPQYYVRRKDGSEFDLNHFFANPQEYENSFQEYTKHADIFIACHFWDQRAPVLISNHEISDPDFSIRIIADVSCDINGPIVSTIRASSIAEPFYGFDRKTGHEIKPFDRNNITVMAVDNLPGELPRDASEDFGKNLISKVIPAFLAGADNPVIKRAAITENGMLGNSFLYLKDYLEGKE